MPRIEKSIEVAVPVRTAYNQWTQFEEFPRFMQGVREVKQLDDTHLHWSMDIGGKPIEWDAEITEQIPDQRISWRSQNGMKSSGTVRFSPLDERRTNVTLAMDYGNLAGKNLKEQELGSRTEEDLQRFARFIEDRGQESGAWRGEVHQGQTTESGQPQAQGRSSVDEERAARGRVAEAGSDRDAARRAGGEGTHLRQDEGGALQRRAQEEASGTAERWLDSTMQAMTREAERFASEVMVPSLGRFTAPMAFGAGPFFSSFFNTMEGPLSMMRRMSEEMDREIESLVWGAPGTARRALVAQAAPLWSPSVDVRRQGDEWRICADLPGVDREDVQIDIEDGQLTITGERRDERDEVRDDGGQRVRRIERMYGRFARKIPLPEGARVDEAEATMSDGVLEIRVPATQQGSQRRIQIRGAETDVGQGTRGREARGPYERSAGQPQ